MATFKFVDDVTITEIMDQSTIANEMQLAADQLAEWSNGSWNSTFENPGTRSLLNPTGYNKIFLSTVVVIIKIS